MLIAIKNTIESKIGKQDRRVIITSFISGAGPAAGIPKIQSFVEYNLTLQDNATRQYELPHTNELHFALDKSRS
jgi:hypothetical protein